MPIRATVEQARTAIARLDVSRSVWEQCPSDVRTAIDLFARALHAAIATADGPIIGEPERREIERRRLQLIAVSDQCTPITRDKILSVARIFDALAADH